MAGPAAGGSWLGWGRRALLLPALRRSRAQGLGGPQRRPSSSSTPGGDPGRPPPPRSGSAFKLPGHKPSNWDKRFLLWTGRFKKAEDIPETVTFEMIDAARNKMRVKMGYLMIIMTIVGCVVMVIEGKRAVRRHESLTSQNLEKKVRWREEAEHTTAKP